MTARQPFSRPRNACWKARNSPTSPSTNWPRVPGYRDRPSTSTSRPRTQLLLALMQPLIQQADKGFEGALENLPADRRRAFREGISTFFTAFGSHSMVARAGTETMATSPDLRTVWSAFMQKWINQTATLIEAERARGAAPDTLPRPRPRHLAQPDERAHDDRDAGSPRRGRSPGTASSTRSRISG